jgi:hypothetical protein
MWAFRSLKTRPHSGCGHCPFSLVSSSGSMLLSAGLCCECRDRMEEIEDRLSYTETGRECDCDCGTIKGDGPACCAGCERGEGWRSAISLYGRGEVAGEGTR